MAELGEGGQTGVGLISDPRSDVPPRSYPGDDNLGKIIFTSWKKNYLGEEDRGGSGISIWDMIAKPIRGIFDIMD